MHHFQKFCRNLQKAQDGITEQHHQHIEQQGGPSGEKEGQPHAVFHFCLLFFPEIIGKKGAASHAHTDQNGCEKGHQGVGGAHCRQGIRAQEPAYDKGIGDIVKLLEEIAQYHGACEKKHVSGYVSLGQIFFHMRSLSPFVRDVSGVRAGAGVSFPASPDEMNRGCRRISSIALREESCNGGRDFTKNGFAAGSGTNRCKNDAMWGYTDNKKTFRAGHWRLARRERRCQ